MKSRVVLGLLLLSVGACVEPWVPESYPVTVDLDAALSDEDRGAALDACAVLNEAVGIEVLRPVEGNGRLIQRGRIHIAPGDPAADRLAEANRSHWSCRVRVEQTSTRILVHELLHCFGLGHDPRRESVLYPAAGPLLMRGHVDAIREQLGLALTESDQPSWSVPQS